MAVCRERMDACNVSAHTFRRPNLLALPDEPEQELDPSSSCRLRRRQSADRNHRPVRRGRQAGDILRQARIGRREPCILSWECALGENDKVNVARC